jgi:hypothetical protein
MSAMFCTRSPGHASQPVAGLCLEATCEEQPLVCRLCACDHHEGHLIITFNHLQRCVQGNGLGELPNEMLRLFAEQEEKIHQSVLEVLLPSCSPATR